MARFVWRLQRVLDLKHKEQDVLESQLMAIADEAMRVRRMIEATREKLATMLSEIGKKDAKERIAEQQFVIRYSSNTETAILQMRNELSAIESRKDEKMQEIIEIKKNIKGYEKLRDKAKIEFNAEEHRLEQNEMDDLTNTASARKIMQMTAVV
jgi:flagellar FliJ protein